MEDAAGRQDSARHEPPRGGVHGYVSEIRGRSLVPGELRRRIRVQRAIDETRRRKRRPQVALELVKEPFVSAAPGDPLLNEVLRRLIATLAEGPRAVVILRYQEDLDPAEIADILEMPLGTVKSHLQRSLALLREKLERRGLGEI